MDSKLRRKFATGLAWLLLMQPSLFLFAQEGQRNHRDLVNQYYIPSEAEPHMSHAEMIKLLRKKVKYVFVIYQENRSFDSYFGTFPGAEGLYQPPGRGDSGLYAGIDRYEWQPDHHPSLPYRTERHVPELHGQWRTTRPHLLRG